MVIKQIAPYGEWASKLTAADLTQGSRSLTSPRVCPLSGRAFFLESRPNGTKGIVEVTAEGPRHVLPEPHSASTAMYEYGGVPYALIPGAEKTSLRIIFSDAKERSLNLLHVDSGKIQQLAQSDTLRYADFDVHPHIADGDEASSWVIAVQEDHTIPDPAQVQNYVIAINIITKQITRVAAGADFYSHPRLNPAATKLVWRQWDHPGLPFEDAKLFWGDWNADGTVTDGHMIVGESGDCVAEPRWSPDGALYFGQEKSNFRQLFRKHIGDSGSRQIVLKGLEDSEIMGASLGVQGEGYLFLTADTIIAAPLRFGSTRLVHINVNTGAWKEIDGPFASLGLDGMARLSATSLLILSSGYSTPLAAYRVDLSRDLEAKIHLIRQAVDNPQPEALYSKPEHIRFKAKKGLAREVHGFFWPPHNPKYIGPVGDLPPLIILSHGGPSGFTSPALQPMPGQYYTSRGYAFFTLNYTGSTGHGRQYREALFGEWGILDRDDAAEAVAYLAETGRIDGRRVGIEGGSAGGYNVLQSLCWYPDVFAGGISYCGVSEISTLVAGTHKLESHYMDVLMDVDGKSEEEKAKVFAARSPLHYAQQITSPLLLIHGDADTVVPIQQSRDIKKKIEDKGGDIKMITLKDEGHVFSRADSWELILHEAEKWWAKTLLKKL
ncbi:peptidase S9 prolyl oligopeptidase active site-containing protein [Thozetella sp. PMI_491]|nr:peptidase S9 prolyl oligopeptidase active site-containing protein [Thozetella sp. PMI_491]